VESAVDRAVKTGTYGQANKNPLIRPVSCENYFKPNGTALKASP
jgi:hypothetical protein